MLPACRLFLCSMRFVERFLVAFALISLIMRLCGMKDGPTLELIAMPLLAAFYLFTFPVLLYGPVKGLLMMKHTDSIKKVLSLYPASICGAGVAYSVISFMLYTLGWLPLRDMLENCCLMLGLVCIIGIVGRWRSGHLFFPALLIRAAILLGIIIAVSLMPLPHIGSLSHGDF